jgi:hypothetical protein
MKHSEVLSRYVNTGQQIQEKQFKRLTPVLKKSYLRSRGIVGFKEWEFEYLTDDQRIKFIEKKGNGLNGDEIDYLIENSNDKDLIITKIIEVKDSTTLQHDIIMSQMTEIYGIGTVEYLLQRSNDKDLIATKIIEKINYDLSNDEIYFLLEYSNDKDLIATKIINEKGSDITYNEFGRLLFYPKDKELIKKLLLQNGVNYEKINKSITDFRLNIPLIPDNYQSMLNEIRRIKEIMI